jgi:hypothetical protein
MANATSGAENRPQRGGRAAKGSFAFHQSTSHASTPNGSLAESSLSRG